MIIALIYMVKLTLSRWVAKWYQASNYANFLQRYSKKCIRTSKSLNLDTQLLIWLILFKREVVKATKIASDRHEV